jgi:hypothetical protein
MSSRLFESKDHIYSEFQYGIRSVEVNHDSSGYIESIFVYNDFMDTLVKVDLESFKERYPNRFEYFQNKVNERII